MIKNIKALCMSLSMFLAIPMPWRVWDEQARQLMILYLFVVGAVIGALEYLIVYFIGITGIPKLIGAAILCVYPFIVTGFIHLDGFMDSMDAILSRRPYEERLRILKDPHVGSFAVIAAIILFVFSFASCAEILSKDFDARLFLFVPVLSRECSAFAVTALKSVSHSQYSGEFKKKINKWHIFIIVTEFVLTLALGYFVCGLKGFIVLICCPVSYAVFLFRGYRSFKGVSGDVSGYALTMAEACTLVVMALF